MLQTREATADTPYVWPLLFPPTCLACDLLLRDDPAVPLCSRCRPQQAQLPDPIAVRRLDPLDPHDPRGPATLVRASWDYDGPLHRPIVALKFSGALALAGPLGRLLAEDPWLVHGPDGCPVDLVIPVPLHWRRRLARGFDQSEELARWTLIHARRRGSSPRLATRVLVRARWTQAQSELDAPTRARNLDAAFAVRRPDQVRGRRVLLLDDVTTTGATFRACAKVLWAAGAESVHGLALLRSL